MYMFFLNFNLLLPSLKYLNIYMVMNFDVRYSHRRYSVNAPGVTVSFAVLLTEPYWLVAVQQNKPPSSGNASAITSVQISSERPITGAINYNKQYQIRNSFN